MKNINPGLDLKAIYYAISDFLSLFDNGTLIIGGDFGCTCEEINIEKLAELINPYIKKGVKIELAGDVGKSLKKLVNLEIVDIKNYEFKNDTLVIYRSKLC